MFWNLVLVALVGVSAPQWAGVHQEEIGFRDHSWIGRYQGWRLSLDRISKPGLMTSGRIGRERVFNASYNIERDNVGPAASDFCQRHLRHTYRFGVAREANGGREGLAGEEHGAVNSFGVMASNTFAQSGRFLPKRDRAIVNIGPRVRGNTYSWRVSNVPENKGNSGIEPNRASSVEDGDSTNADFRLNPGSSFGMSNLSGQFGSCPSLVNAVPGRFCGRPGFLERFADQQHAVAGNEQFKEPQPKEAWSPPRNVLLCLGVALFVFGGLGGFVAVKRASDAVDVELDGWREAGWLLLAVLGAVASATGGTLAMALFAPS